MDVHELRDLGRQIARDIAAGLMATTAAGAVVFSREMHAAHADADRLINLGDWIEQEKTILPELVQAATGLRRLARRLEATEQVFCDQIEAHTLELPARTTNYPPSTNTP